MNRHWESGAMWDLQRHSGLVRLCLGVGGRLTLTGLHQPRPQLRWRLSTALTLGCFALLALASVLAPVRSVKEVMDSTAVTTFLLQAGVALITFVTQPWLSAEAERAAGGAGAKRWR